MIASYLVFQCSAQNAERKTPRLEFSAGVVGASCSSTKSTLNPKMLYLRLLMHPRSRQQCGTETTWWRRAEMRPCCTLASNVGRLASPDPISLHGWTRGISFFFFWGFFLILYFVSFCERSSD